MGIWMALVSGDEGSLPPNTSSQDMTCHTGGGSYLCEVTTNVSTLYIPSSLYSWISSILWAEVSSVLNKDLGLDYENLMQLEKDKFAIQKF